ncbi:MULTISPECIES: hypothetical protein [unclassified Streptomyces]|nr:MULTISPECIES: hypothetical protein [unclassified Streptomyces]
MNPPSRRLRAFRGDRGLFHGQPVAVVATTLEAAQHGASLVLGEVG